MASHHSQSFFAPSSSSVGDNGSNNGGHEPIESLNQLMDPVSFLTESDMQQDLDFFANAQFSYDIPPAAAAVLYTSQQEKWPTTPTCEDEQHQQHHSFPNDDEPLSPQEDERFLSDPHHLDPATLESSCSTDSSPSHLRPQKLSKDEKRKRNTAASARFRIKKKMREQALQRTAFEMTEKTKGLEAHIKELQREIKWLKSLVMEKNEGRLAQLVQERPPVCTHHLQHQQ